VKTLVLGGDGFCGWPTALHLSKSGHDTIIVDNLSRRSIDLELGVSSLTPIKSIQERIQAWYKLTKNLSEQFPKLIIAVSQPSKFRNLTKEEHSALGMELNNSGAKIFFIGLGCPRQEVFVYEHMTLVNYPMLAVGAAFDFHAGCLKQAPSWMQKSGLEWFFRLIIEPKRLWRRYIFLNPEYVYRVLRQKLFGDPKTTKYTITSARSKYFG
jgi:exopolysaccharide biosynthesis WecB/TagA/CpsF family protein